jgi:hypothetical protein
MISSLCGKAQAFYVVHIDAFLTSTPVALIGDVITRAVPSMDWTTILPQAETFTSLLILINMLITHFSKAIRRPRARFILPSEVLAPVIICIATCAPIDTHPPIRAQAD